MERHINFQHQQFSVLEAAAHLRVSRSFMYKLISQGKLTPTKFGNRTIFTGSELERFVKAAQRAA